MHKASTFVVLIVALATFAIASSAALPRYHGQDIYAEPDCSIVTDHSRLFRDISDPTHYWVCPEGQKKADYIQCPDNYAFIESDQKCVVWEEWKWIEPYLRNKMTPPPAILA